MVQADVFRLLNLIHEYNREMIYMEADISIPEDWLIRKLN
jgi:hypothetical protein